MRICSLIPGATEVVAALGLAEDLVGISHECDFPPEVRNKPVMVRAAIQSDQLTSPEINRQVQETLARGQQLYALDEARLQQAGPDLVITQEMCHVCAITPRQVERAIGAWPRPPQLLSLDPTSLDHILADVERIGAATGRKPQAQAYAEALRTRLRAITERVASAAARPRVVCLEWLDPLYVAGHWIPQMVALAGGLDPLGSTDAPSRTVTWDEITAVGPEILVLMPCGFSVDRTVQELGQLAFPCDPQALPAVRNSRVFAVDGSSYFSRPGPRLVEGVAILASLCHPALFEGTQLAGVRRVDLRSLQGS